MMDTKGSDSLKTTRVTEWTVNQGGYLPISFGAFLISGCLLAYIIAVLRGNVDAFLPLISDAAGSPPQNGLFGTLICIGGMLGVFFMFLRYLIVIEQNQEKSKTVNRINKISLAVGIASMCGITLITGYPANFYRDRDVWLNHVGIPHMMGGIVLFSLGLLYTAMQCVLTLYLRRKHQLMLLLRISLCLAATVAFVYHLVTVPDNFGAVKMENNSSAGMLDTNISVTQQPLRDLRLHIDTGGSYISSAISQWLLTLFFCCFFFTFFSEVQEYSLLIVIETSDPDLDVKDEVAVDDYGSRDGPSTYTRKTSHACGNVPTGVNNGAAFPKSSEMALSLRRDSSCQTKDEMFPNGSPYTNGSSTPVKNENPPTTENPPVIESENIDDMNGYKENKNGLSKEASVRSDSTNAKEENAVVSEKHCDMNGYKENQNGLGNEASVTSDSTNAKEENTVVSEKHCDMNEYKENKNDLSNEASVTSDSTNDKEENTVVSEYKNTENNESSEKL